MGLFPRKCPLVVLEHIDLNYVYHHVHSRLSKPQHNSDVARFDSLIIRLTPNKVPQNKADTQNHPYLPHQDITYANVLYTKGFMIYIYITSHRPRPYLTNLTFPRMVCFLSIPGQDDDDVGVIIRSTNKASLFMKSVFLVAPLMIRYDVRYAL